MQQLHFASRKKSKEEKRCCIVFFHNQIVAHARLIFRISSSISALFTYQATTLEIPFEKNELKLTSPRTARCGVRNFAPTLVCLWASHRTERAQGIFSCGTAKPLFRLETFNPYKLPTHNLSQQRKEATCQPHCIMGRTHNLGAHRYGTPHSGEATTQQRR